MIAQGTDGVSRGVLNQGSTGLDMLSFITLHFTAIQRNPQVTNWIKSWLGNDSEILTPELWFTWGHSHDGGYYDKMGFWGTKIRPGKFVWCPPPAAADVAIEEL
jgi:hypothetical protein